MVVSLKKNSIVLTPESNSINLKPLLYFIDNNFQKVKYFSNCVVISNEKSEEVKKKYLLKWAYKIHEKNLSYQESNFFQLLIASYALPLYIITPPSNAVVQLATITIDQINKNEISVSSSQYQDKIAQYFKLVFKDSIILFDNRSTFNILIKTKAHLALLKGILKKKEILNISIVFVTQGLNFKRLHPQDTNSAEYLYREKLQKSHTILSISDDSTMSEIKKNYRNMLKKYHPDIVYNKGEDLIKLYTRRFQVIQHAYEIVRKHHKIA